METRCPIGYIGNGVTNNLTAITAMANNRSDTSKQGVGQVEREDYIPLQQAARLCDYTQEYLSLRARQGKLKAKKRKGRWMTKRKWLDEYIERAEAYKRSVRYNDESTQDRPSGGDSVNAEEEVYEKEVVPRSDDDASSVGSAPPPEALPTAPLRAPVYATPPLLERLQGGAEIVVSVQWSRVRRAIRAVGSCLHAVRRSAGSGMPSSLIAGVRRANADVKASRRVDICVWKGIAGTILVASVISGGMEADVSRTIVPMLDDTGEQVAATVEEHARAGATAVGEPTLAAVTRFDRSGRLIGDMLAVASQDVNGARRFATAKRQLSSGLDATVRSIAAGGRAIGAAGQQQINAAAITMSYWFTPETWRYTADIFTAYGQFVQRTSWSHRTAIAEGVEGAAEETSRALASIKTAPRHVADLFDIAIDQAKAQLLP